MTKSPEIRPERPADFSAIRSINELAFGGPGEAKLVDALRDGGGLTLSLVAIMSDTVVAHIAFSPILVGDGEAATAALALAPMAVHPDWQRQGIGSKLIRAGLDQVRSLRHRLVIVLGHPEYYPRFGFIPAAPFGISCPYPAPDEAFLLVELQPDAARECRGLVAYRPEFAEL